MNLSYDILREHQLCGYQPVENSTYGSRGSIMLDTLECTQFIEIHLAKLGLFDHLRIETAF